MCRIHPAIGRGTGPAHGETLNLPCVTQSGHDARTFDDRIRGVVSMMVVKLDGVDAKAREVDVAQRVHTKRADRVIGSLSLSLARMD
jgi:hypothetical protein